jgi:hypothetical protein
MIDFEKNTIDLDLFKRILNELRSDNYNMRDRIIDSFSTNQFKAKETIVNKLVELNIITKESRIAIMGGWFGSILIPALIDKVAHIDLYDLDEITIRISKNIICPDYKNVRHYIRNVFDDIPTDMPCKHVHPNSKEYHEPAVLNWDVLINPSCEHMPPMRDWPWWFPNKYFCLTSNNMFDIEDHINCVSTIDDFIMQLPPCDILHEDIISDDRGDRFLIIGKTNESLY